MEGLFREEVLRARRPQWLGTVRLSTPISHQLWGLVAAFTTAAILLWLCLGQYPRREHVAGQLSPASGMLTVSSSGGGTVTRVLVREGAPVIAGQPLAELSGNSVSVRMGDTHAAVSRQLHAQEAQVLATLADGPAQAGAEAEDLHSRIAMLQAQLRQVYGQVALQREQAETTAHLVHKIKPLRARGFVSTVEYDRYQAAALADQAQVKALMRQRLDTEQKLSLLRAQLTRLPLDTAEKEHQLRSQLAQLHAQLAQNEAQRDAVLRAPRAGIVSSLLIKPGQTVAAGQPMLSILPRGSELEAELLVSSSAIGFVRKGTPVVLHYQAFPYQKFGVQHGAVMQVSRSALSPQEVATLLGRPATPEPLYRVEVKLAAQSVEANGEQHALLPGMALDADMLLDRRRMIEWIFEPLYGMAKRGGGDA